MSTACKRTAHGNRDFDPNLRSVLLKDYRISRSAINEIAE